MVYLSIISQIFVFLPILLVGLLYRCIIAC